MVYSMEISYILLEHGIYDSMPFNSASPNKHTISITHF